MDIYRLDKIAYVDGTRVVAAVVDQLLAEIGMDIRLVGGGYVTVLWEDEGKTWVRGWEGPAYNALLTVLTLSGRLEHDDDWSAYT